MTDVHALADEPAPSPSPSRHARRKARTRDRITQAANELFTEQGYLETSAEDISNRADVALRTIYTHFPSKAAILLDHFDRWLIALVDGILERPVDEPIADAVVASLAAMTEAGWPNRSYGNVLESPPSSLGLFAGPPEIAGYTLQGWVRAVDRLTSDAFERGGYPPDSPVPAARAAALFAACLAPVLAAQMSVDGDPLPADATANGLIEEFMLLLTRPGADCSVPPASSSSTPTPMP